jgi:hypothetical protein
MEEVKIIYVDSLTGLEPARNFLMYDTVEGKWYIGNDTSMPQELVTSGTPTYQNLFMLMGS